MGTRNLTMVHLHGELKVAQYGQWDGYPTGQGYRIAEFLRKRIGVTKPGLKDFAEKVGKLYFVTEEAVEKAIEAAGDNWTKVHPEFSRDTGAEILELVAKGKVKALNDMSEFLKDDVFCEWAYDVDLTTDTVVVFRGGVKWKVLTFKEFVKPGMMKKLEAEARGEANG
jgi:hypothetical protein